MATRKEQYKAIARETSALAAQIIFLLDQFKEEDSLERTMHRLQEANDSLRVIKGVLIVNKEIYHGTPGECLNLPGEKKEKAKKRKKP